MRVFAAVAELVISASSWTKKAGRNHEQEPFVRPPPLTEGCTFCMTIDFVEDILCVVSFVVTFHFCVMSPGFLCHLLFSLCLFQTGSCFRSWVESKNLQVMVASDFSCSTFSLCHTVHSSCFSSFKKVYLEFTAALQCWYSSEGILKHIGTLVRIASGSESMTLQGC